jgi:hypothetical protein
LFLKRNEYNYPINNNNDNDNDDNNNNVMVMIMYGGQGGRACPREGGSTRGAAGTESAAGGGHGQEQVRYVTDL